ncbi:MAG: hypothetical protein AB1611_18750 [bacterium]
MEQYRHYADYLIKMAMSDAASVDHFLRYVLFTDSLWQPRIIRLGKRVQGLEGPWQRVNLNEVIKQETLDGGLLFDNVRIIIEGESSLSAEDIYQLLRQEAAALKPGEKRLPLIAVIISLARSSVHLIRKKAHPFLEVTKILGPKTFIGFASINLHSIDIAFYQEYMRELFQDWSLKKAEHILNGSFSSLLLGYCVRQLWLRKDTDNDLSDKLGVLKGFLERIWKKAAYANIFYETLGFFIKDLPDLYNYFDEGGIKMKSFIDTIPKGTREIYKEVLVTPVVKEYQEKLKQLKMEKKRAEKEKKRAEKERERTEKEMERERAEKERERTEKEMERERAEKEREKEKSELQKTCQLVVSHRFPDIPAASLMSISQLSFSDCSHLLRELEGISNAHDCEILIENLCKKAKPGASGKVG